MWLLNCCITILSQTHVSFIRQMRRQGWNCPSIFLRVKALTTTSATALVCAFLPTEAPLFLLTYYLLPHRAISAKPFLYFRVQTSFFLLPFYCSWFPVLKISRRKTEKEVNDYQHRRKKWVRAGKGRMGTVTNTALPVRLLAIHRHWGVWKEERTRRVYLINAEIMRLNKGRSRKKKNHVHSAEVNT